MSTIICLGQLAGQNWLRTLNCSSNRKLAKTKRRNNGNCWFNFFSCCTRTIRHEFRCWTSFAHNIFVNAWQSILFRFQHFCHSHAVACICRMCAMQKTYTREKCARYAMHANKSQSRMWNCFLSRSCAAIPFDAVFHSSLFLYRFSSVAHHFCFSSFCSFAWICRFPFSAVSRNLLPLWYMASPTILTSHFSHCFVKDSSTHTHKHSIYSLHLCEVCVWVCLFGNKRVQNA